MEDCHAFAETVGALRYKIIMRVLDAQQAFFAARRPRKDSPNTTEAYRRDLAGITTVLASETSREPADLDIDHLTAPALRTAFGVFADTHAKSSVLRAWSTWNQFLTFCVSDGLLAGNPMGAVARPKTPPLVPKPLRGEDTPERLLTAAADGASGTRDPWPERDVLVIALGLVAGLRAAEMRSLSMNALVGRSGEMRLHVTGKGSRDRSIPVEQAMEKIIGNYLDSCRRRFPHQKYGPSAPLLRDRAGEPLDAAAWSISSNRVIAGQGCMIAFPWERICMRCGILSRPAWPKTAHRLQKLWLCWAMPVLRRVRIILRRQEGNSGPRFPAIALIERSTSCLEATKRLKLRDSSLCAKGFPNNNSSP
jgi:site-specific recombinase XerC